MPAKDGRRLAGGGRTDGDVGPSTTSTEKDTIMKPRILITLIAAAAFAAGMVASAPATFTAAKNSSAVLIEGTSTLHAWKMEGSTIDGSIDLDAPEGWKSAAARIVIPVASIRTDKAKMNALMQKALEAKTHPEIRYELLSATPVRNGGDTFVVRTTGKLTIAGVSREVTLDVTGTRAGAGRYLLTGEAAIRMSDFGIKPPTAMLGTIKTGNDVKVTFRWTVDRTN